MKHFTILFLAAFISGLTFGQDTFSICAVDTITGEVGSAGASCLDDGDIEGGVLIISDVHPGVGVVHTQSYWLPANQQYAKELMDDGFSPTEIINLLVFNDAQNNPNIRQYGVVDFRDGVARSAAYTGNNCLNYKNHILGPNYAIQGNILLGQQILDSMEARFLRAEGSLVCRLMEALQGANVVGADSRCAPYGVSSLSAFVRVAKPDDPVGDLFVDLVVPEVYPGVDPIDSLQTLVDQWGGCAFTNVQNQKAQLSVKTYPNPADQIVTFEIAFGNLSSEGEMDIYDSQGKIVYRISDLSQRDFKWDTSSEKPGIYFYRIMNEGKLMTSGKIIVK